MATIKRPNTNELTHVATTCIKAYQAVSEDTALFNCVRSSGGGGAGSTESVYKASPNMLRRLMHGNGALHKDLQYGVKAIPHFEGQLLIDSNDPTTVIGIHMIPTKDYNAADMSAELEMPVAAESAIVQLYPSGEIDILAYPSSLYRHILDFLKTLEAKQKLTTGDQFSSGNITYIVQQIAGDLVTLRCREKKALA